jgi:hypothetical protein
MPNLDYKSDMPGVRLMAHEVQHWLMRHTLVIVGAFLAHQTWMHELTADVLVMKSSAGHASKAQKLAGSNATYLPSQGIAPRVLASWWIRMPDSEHHHVLQRKGEHKNRVLCGTCRNIQEHGLMS